MKWERVVLGDICRPKQWRTLSKAEMSHQGFPVYGANGQIGFSETYTHEKPVILVGCRGSCGTVHVTEPKSYANGNAMALDALNERRVFLKFLEKFLRYRGFSDTISGTSQPQIIRANIVKVDVFLPPLAEQVRIAGILDAADALRAKRREALAQLDTLLQSTFLDMFGDPVTNPMGWEERLLGEICDVRDGTHDSPRYVESGHPLLTSKNFKDGEIDFEAANLISDEDFTQINKRSKVGVGDLVMPMIGTIGNPVLVEHEPHFAIKNVALIKFAKGSPDNRFIRALLCSHYFDHITLKANRGGTQKFVALKDLRGMPIPLPRADLQHRFAAIVESVERQKARMRAHLAELDALFASLQSRAFSGTL